MNITDKTIEGLKQAGYDITFRDKFYNECSKLDCVEYCVHATMTSGMEYFPKFYHFKPKKSETTLSYLMEQIAKKENYESINWNEIFAPLKLDNVYFYITSYGIGVETLFSNKTETRGKIDAFLNEHGIEYTNEYSDAAWVFRYKISKSKENINKINALQHKK